MRLLIFRISKSTIAQAKKNARNLALYKGQTLSQTQTTLSHTESRSSSTYTKALAVAVSERAARAQAEIFMVFLLFCG
jgi:hypothetical protein